MRRPAYRWLAVPAAAILLAAGCGGDDDDDGGGDRLTKSEFLAQGNAICKSGNDAIDAMFEELFPDEESFADEDLQQEAKDGLVENVQQQLDDLGELQPPEDLEDDVDALLEDAQAALDEVKDQSPEELFNQEEDPFAEVNAQAGALGLTECDDSENG
jgi:hypothetical protein